MSLTRPVQRLLPIAGRVDLKAQRLQDIPQHQAVVGLVVRDQHATPRPLVPGDVAGRSRPLPFVRRCHRQDHVKPERAAMSRRALHLQAAAHHRHNLLAEGQTQTGPFGPLASLAHLLKRLEDPLRLLRGDAGPRILNLAAQGDLRFSGLGFRLVNDRDRQGHTPPVGELDRVAQQVEQDLPQTRLVGQHGGRVRGRGLRRSARVLWPRPGRA